MSMKAQALFSTLSPRCPGAVRRCAARRPGAGLRLAAAQVADHSFELHFGDTTVAFPLDKEGTRQLATAVAGVLQTFADKQKAERPKRWDTMEFRLQGDPAASNELESLEVVCNPNAYPTAFDARVLVTLRTAGGVRLATEGKLSALKADIQNYAERWRQASA